MNNIPVMQTTDFFISAKNINDLVVKFSEAIAYMLLCFSSLLSFVYLYHYFTKNIYDLPLIVFSVLFFICSFLFPNMIFFVLLMPYQNLSLKNLFKLHRTKYHNFYSINNSYWSHLHHAHPYSTSSTSGTPHFTSIKSLLFTSIENITDKKTHEELRVLSRFFMHAPISIFYDLELQKFYITSLKDNLFSDNNFEKQNEFLLNFLFNKLLPFSFSIPNHTKSLDSKKEMIEQFIHDNLQAYDVIDIFYKNQRLDLLKKELDHFKLPSKSVKKKI